MIRIFARTALFLSLVLMLSLGPVFTGSQKAMADSARDFIMSCSYGVLAGTLVGAATLAFSEKPGENLNRVARGASFGLYGGILLGLYVIYGIPSQEERMLRDQLGGMPAESVPSMTRTNAQLTRFMIAPVFSERGLEGGELRYELANF
ncbi:MAG: hypothetical protein RBT63_04435 [Bdellovibrionales bacterium]|jgi:hypothetical protein|nr:hypothetical protein [Bdellovibrionales bacterium]